jgi:hypothetical protein
MPHRKQRFTTPEPADKDLQQNPGIGQSTGIDNLTSTFEDEEGNSTVEGDVMNETDRTGAVRPEHRGRTNK